MNKMKELTEFKLNGRMRRKEKEITVRSIQQSFTFAAEGRPASPKTGRAES
jgi:hypothetical protein